MAQIKQKKINPRQEKFCMLYATDKEFFGNGVQAYIEVYTPNTLKPNWYKTAKAEASRLLSNANLCKRINELLESEGLNNEFVDKQTLFLITQHSDFNSKIRAIQEYNKLKQRVQTKLDITSGGEQLKELTGIFKKLAEKKDE